MFGPTFFFLSEAKMFLDLIIFTDPNFWSTGYGLGSTPQVIGGSQQQYQNKIFTSSSHFMRKGLGRSGKHEKQAGAELGQAQLKLELEICW